MDDRIGGSTIQFEIMKRLVDMDEILTSKVHKQAAHSKALKDDHMHMYKYDIDSIISLDGSIRIPKVNQHVHLSIMLKLLHLVLQYKLQYYPGMVDDSDAASLSFIETDNLNNAKTQFKSKMHPLQSVTSINRMYCL